MKTLSLVLGLLLVSNVFACSEEEAVASFKKEFESFTFDDVKATNLKTAVIFSVKNNFQIIATFDVEGMGSLAGLFLVNKETCKFKQPKVGQLTVNSLE